MTLQIVGIVLGYIFGGLFTNGAFCVSQKTEYPGAFVFFALMICWPVFLFANIATNSGRVFGRMLIKIK